MCGKSPPLNIFYRSLVILVSKVENEKRDLGDAREISAFITYFKENHTVVIGNKTRVISTYINTLCLSVCLFVQVCLDHFDLETLW